jgi:excisionase family DNA binding protein
MPGRGDVRVSVFHKGGIAMGEALLKVAEAAVRLSVGDDWVYERINRGEIPVVELGDTRKNQRIRESDLDSFITARTFGRTA